MLKSKCNHLGIKRVITKLRAPANLEIELTQWYGWGNAVVKAEHVPEKASEQSR